MKLQVTKHTKEVEDRLSLAVLKNNSEKAEKLQRYLGTKLNVLGLLTKTQVDICKQGFSFYTPDIEQTLLHFDAIYHHSNNFEVKSQALIYLDKNYHKIDTTTILNVIPNWVRTVDNWAHSDYLSKFLTRVIEHLDTSKKMMSIVKTWSNSANLWERRQALVSMYYYSRTKKQHVDFEVSKQLILKLIKDKEYFVQKAIGWTLRESYNVYPKLTYKLIEENVKHITSVAFTTCIEKMNSEEKLYLKKIRK